MTRNYIRAYNELYLPNAMVTLATMLDYAVNFMNENADAVFKRFIDCGSSVYFENGDPAIITGKSGVELYCMITGRYTNLPIYSSFDRSPIYWLGRSLAYYQWYTVTSFKDIHMRISLSEMLTWYSTLHEADISRFVDTLNSRLFVKQTNLEYFRKRAGLTQKALSQLSGVSLRSIQLYEQRQNDISKAQFNMLNALSSVLNCSVYDLTEQNGLLHCGCYNPQYSQDHFFNELTRIVERNRLNSRLQMQQAQETLLQRCYAWGYVGQFPYQQLQYVNCNYLMPQQTFISNWDGYWYRVLQQRHLANNDVTIKTEISKIGLKVLNIMAKSANRPLLSAVTDVIGIITADSLAEAIASALSMIMTTTGR